MSHSIQVLIISADQARRRQWAEWLDAPDFHVSHARAGEENLLGHTPPDIIQASDFLAPDIILADIPLWAELPPWAEAWEQQRSRGEIGVVALPPNTAGDVVLAADCTQRELRLACRLLAKIVRLRRRQHNEARTRRALRQLAQTDPLTGLANLRAWREEWTRRLAQPPHAAEPLCLALFDLDGFRKVNKRRGHRAGDELLKRLSQQFAKAIRPHDFVARLGGDEFGLLLSGVEPADASHVVERLRGALAEPAGDATPAISASAGFVSIAPDEKNIERQDALFDRAETALRCAKRQGGNQTSNAADLPRHQEEKGFNPTEQPDPGE